MKSSKNYPELLLKQNLKLISSYTQCKAPHKMLCLICNNEFDGIILGKIQAFEKYGKNGCPHCFKKRNKIKVDNNIQSLLDEISKNGYEIEGKFKGDFFSDQNAKILVRKKYCDHVFDANPISLKKSNWSQCKVCSRHKIEGDDFLERLGFSVHTFNKMKYFSKNGINVFIHDINKIQQRFGHKMNWLLELNKKFPNDNRMIHLFSDELENPIWELKIKNMLFEHNVKKIHARKCIIKEVPRNEKSIFLDAYHNQGNDSGQINYGAYFENELVAVMTFTKPRIFMSKGDKTGEIELSRFATNLNYRINGIASKLLEHFKKRNEYKTIFSYADRRYSLGNVYYKLGFKLEHIVHPNYFYIIDGKRKYRWQYRKDSLKEIFPELYNPDLTEYQNMLNLGYDRIWDCGSLKFVMKL